MVAPRMLVLLRGQCRFRGRCGFVRVHVHPEWWWPGRVNRPPCRGTGPIGRRAQEASRRFIR
eukprot:1171789-Alexandrium_andersonii.AAC.1